MFVFTFFEKRNRYTFHQHPRQHPKDDSQTGNPILPRGRWYWELQEESRALKGFHQLRSSDSPPTTPAIARVGASIVVRTWSLPKIVTRVPSHQECHKWTTNSRYLLAHTQPRGEPRALPRHYTQTTRRALGLTSSSHSTPKERTSGPYFSRHSQLPYFFPT